MNKFEISLALNGNTVVTREGKKVDSIRFVNGIVYAEIGNKSFKYTKDGKLLNSGISSKFDLFMQPSSLVGYFKLFWNMITEKSKHF